MIFSIYFLYNWRFIYILKISTKLIGLQHLHPLNKHEQIYVEKSCVSRGIFEFEYFSKIGLTIRIYIIQFVRYYERLGLPQLPHLPEAVENIRPQDLAARPGRLQASSSCQMCTTGLFMKYGLQNNTCHRQNEQPAVFFCGYQIILR